MKLHRTLLLLTGICTSSLTADTIILKTGDQYEGKVLSEDASSYLVEINVTKSIRDERRIPKDKVKEIVKTSAAEKNFKALGQLTPTPDGLSIEHYNERIKAAKDFLRLHPREKQSEAVKASLATLEKEAEVITDGGLKLDGKLIPASDIESDAYEIDARLLAADFVALAKQGQHQQSLRKWETLENDYGASEAYAKYLPLAARIMSAYQKYLDTQLKTLDARLEKRQSVLTSLSDNDRSRAERTISLKKAKYEALIEKEEKELRTRWLTLDPYDEDALKYNHRSTETELKALSKVDTSSIKMAGPTYRKAYTAINDGEVEEASKLIRELSSSYRLPEKYTSKLTTQLEEKEAEIAAAEKKAEEEKAAKELEALEAAKKAEEDAKKKPAKP
ncbi:hypothetical protein JO972_07755 [Verrucomicrobiaceae bacterium 5K15]|uniref:Uncharacterized protein n=1 Tax=Oceaniferula flava TaxID=2800421 RepID=A0AAE2VBV2_9BACT|nr:PTPDL family protein [Oceaniferula flavus]MBK1854850.1 hypothetical protein [Oceaniferula flavus]MBM1136156.1 hypothetical protein [Oceaniferula flavus]